MTRCTRESYHALNLHFHSVPTHPNVCDLRCLHALSCLTGTITHNGNGPSKLYSISLHEVVSDNYSKHIHFLFPVLRITPRPQPVSALPNLRASETTHPRSQQPNIYTTVNNTNQHFYPQADLPRKPQDIPSVTARPSNEVLASAHHCPFRHQAVNPLSNIQTPCVPTTSRSYRRELEVGQWVLRSLLDLECVSLGR